MNEPLKVRCLLTTDGKGRKAKAEALRELVRFFNTRCHLCVEPPDIHPPLQKRIFELEEAIAETLDENRNLADGEDCTLRHLKRVLSWGDGIFREGGKWWFWDETEADKCGPFENYREASESLEQYARNL